MDTKKIKVLFIIPTLNPGGIETYLLRFLNFIKEDTTLESYVLVKSFERGKLYEQYASLGLPIYFQPLGYLNPIKIWWYYSFFKREQFDTVCDFNANFAGISIWLAKHAGVINRITFYRQGKDHFKPSRVKKIYNLWVNYLVHANSTQILSNSKASLDYFFPQWNSDNRFKVIYNGMNVEDFHFEGKNLEIRNELGIPQEALVVCHSGRLDSSKNHPTILKVAEQLIQMDKNIYFILCGLNTEKLQKEVDALGIADNINLLGFRKDVPRILNASDVFYFPSLTEGQPNALIEAMLTGLPFVASNIAPIKEIVPENLNSFLVDPLDVEGSVKAIKDVQESKHDKKVKSTQKWARDYFSQEWRLREFYNCLVKLK